MDRARVHGPGGSRHGGGREQLQQVLRSAEPVIDGEVLAETPAHPGERRCYRHSYYPDIGAAGQVIGVCCVVQDVTARKQAETELAERNRELEGANVRMAKIVADFGQTNEALKREALAAAEARARLEKAKKALQRLALYDTLTGIGNRELFSRQ
jgi:hypothetical protein